MLRQENYKNLKNININVYFLIILYLSSSKYEAVVIGSGFGGTILSLSLGNKYKKEGEGKKVCILERGQWWISPEVPLTKEGTIDHKSTIREYLVDKDMPYGVFPYPDNHQGLVKVIGNSRAINKVEGLYDIRSMRNVNVISASGVGGGSLIYFNVTEKPDPSIYMNWPTEKDGHASLSEYFDMAESFLGVNFITTTAGLGNYILPRTRVFQTTANSINNKQRTGIVSNKKDSGELKLDARLSITDVSKDLFVIDDSDNSERYIVHPTVDELKKYSNEENVCQREGRCGLGCIPDSRHSLEKKIYAAINKEGRSVEVYPLCEVDSIEENQDAYYKYKINFTDRRENKDGVKSTIEAKLVVLAAGTLGSTEILLRSEHLQLSNTLGNHFSTNGDLFGVINPTIESVDASRGPQITSIVRYKDNSMRTDDKIYSIEDIGIPKMFAEIVATIFDLMVQEKGARNFIDIFKDIIVKKVTDSKSKSHLAQLIKGFEIRSSNVLVNMVKELSHDLEKIALGGNKILLSPEESVNNIMVLFGMGADSGNGHLVIDHDNYLSLKDDYDLNQEVYNLMILAMQQFAQEIGKDGKDSLMIPLWDKRNNKTAISAHPLGGCPMGNDASNGVVDSMGRVFKGSDGNEIYDGLYVVDGSIIPSPLGVNPSLTIAALSFRIALNIIGDNSLLPN